MYIFTYFCYYLCIVLLLFAVQGTVNRIMFTVYRRIHDMHLTDINEVSEILQRFYRAFRIPVSLYSHDQLQTSYVAIAFEPDPASLYLKNVLASENKNTARTFYTAHHDICCGMVYMEQTQHRIIIGPVSAIPPTPAQCKDILADLDLPFTKKRELLYWLKKTPILSRDRFISLLKFLDYIVNGHDDLPADADQVEITDYPDTPLEDVPEVYHNTFELEKLVLDAVEHGKRDELLALLMKVSKSNAAVGMLSKDSIRIYKNTYIISVSLISRAAIRGGMDYDYALTLSDAYIRDIENETQESNIPPMIGVMMLDYCTQVAELNKPQNCSPLTVAILDHINRSLHEALTVAGIADHLQRSCSYISHIFEQEMHMPLKQYILQQKIKEARYLLTSTQNSISEISVLLGFSSQPHFQTVFKRLTGVTPSNYRKSIHQLSIDK